MGGLENPLDGRFDGHAHVFTTDLAMAGGRRYTPEQDASFDSYAYLLRAHRLDGALLTQPSFLGDDNTYLLDSLERAARYPDLRFRGVCVVDPACRPDELRRLAAAGIVGLRLNLFGRAGAFNIKQWRQTLGAADQLGWHVEVYCEGAALPPIAKAVARVCHTIVIDHFGLPQAGEPCAGQNALFGIAPQRLFIKASAPYRVFPDQPSADAAEGCVPIFKQWYEHVGPTRLVWGSDWPWTRFEGRHSYADTLRWKSLWFAAAGSA